MAYGDYSGPDKPNKGHEGGACNRQRCQAEPAIWYNHGSGSWYCADCKRDIGEDSFNKRDWAANWQPRLGHPMFETREQMIARHARTVISGLGDLHILALDELCAEVGRGPSHLAPVLRITIPEARDVLAHLRREGVVDYGGLFSEDDGLACGRGYWLDTFGLAVKAQIEADRQTGFAEDHGGIYGENYGDRSVKRSHRGEGRNYVD